LRSVRIDYAAMVSCNVIIADTVTTLFGRMGVAWFQDPQHTFATRGIVIALSTLLVMLPLSLYKNIGKLAKVHFVESRLYILLIDRCIDADCLTERYAVKCTK
jgi:hypothetical protein